MNRWFDGVVTLLYEGPTKVYFVYTSDGKAALFPRVYDRNPGVRVGAYVRVRLIPPPKYGKNKEVQDLNVIDRPVDHEVN
ncbi:hypothetical protein PFISCL1PPCAC_16270, partial [Pristionchus fissidentatus]